MKQILNWNFKVGKLAGIDIRIHWMLLGYMIFQLADWLSAGKIVYGIALMAALWVIVLLHELGHCFMARQRKQPVKEIILWPLGGLAMVGQSRSHDDNIWIALAGPAVNIIVAVLLWAALLATGQKIEWDLLSPLHLYGDSLLADIFNMNWVLILLNLFLPVFPLDGGRIFVGILSKHMQESRVFMTAGTTTMLGGLGIALWSLTEHNIINFGAGLALVLQGTVMRQKGLLMNFKLGKKPAVLEVLTNDLKQKQSGLRLDQQARASKEVKALLDDLTGRKVSPTDSGEDQDSNLHF